MENKLIQVYQIEPETKHKKLLEELDELNVAARQYRKSGNIYPVLKELADVSIIILGIAIYKHSVTLSEFKYIVNDKLGRSIRIKRKMKVTGKTYDQIRRG